MAREKGLRKGLMEKILKLVEEKGIVGFREVSKILDVPYATVRFYAKKLYNEGSILLIKVGKGSIMAYPSIFRPDFLKKHFREDIERIKKLAKLYGLEVKE